MPLVGMLLRIPREECPEPCWLVVVDVDEDSMRLDGPFPSAEAAAHRIQAEALNTGGFTVEFRGNFEWPFVSEPAALVSGTRRNGRAIWRITLVPEGEAFILGMLAGAPEKSIHFSRESAQEAQDALLAAEG